MTPPDLAYKLYLDRGPLRARLLRLLRRSGLRWEDVSPAPGAPRVELRRRMRAADAVVLVAPEARLELDLARALGRPVIGVVPRGERTAPDGVPALLDERVGWNPELLADCIRQYALPD